MFLAQMSLSITRQIPINWRWAWDLLRGKLKNIIRCTYDRKYSFQNEKKMKQNSDEAERSEENYLPLWDKVKHIRMRLEGDELEK